MKLSLETALQTVARAKVPLTRILIMLIILLQIVTMKDTWAPLYLSLAAFAFFAFWRDI